MITDIYGFDAEFALIFGGNAVLMALAILFVERMVRRYSTFPVIQIQVAGLIVVSLIYVGVAIASDGVPAFWLWFVVTTMLLALNSSSSPLLQSLAMEPMGAIAGTAASVSGAIIFVGGAILGSIIDRFIVDTVTPFGTGFAIYGIVICLLVLALKRELSVQSVTSPAS